jgi:hypothetical protein
VSDVRWYASPHFDGRRFFNPSGANDQPAWKVPRILVTRRRPWPAEASAWNTDSPCGADEDPDDGDDGPLPPAVAAA